MAEAHPVGFRWVMKARERGAKVIHVDPRFSRTSAMADLHVPIRAGTDIAFLGGLIRHVLETESYFQRVRRQLHERRRRWSTRSSRTPRTSAGSSPASTPSRAPTTRRPGRTRAARSLAAGRASTPRRRSRRAPAPACCRHVQRDETLSTRAASSRSCAATSRATRRRWSSGSAASRPSSSPQVADALIANSGRERTTALCYAVGWTQHTAGVQMIRAGRDPAAPARQHRPPRRRHHRAARPRVDPGLDRHPDALRPAAGLPAHAAGARGGARRWRATSTPAAPTAGWWSHFDKYIVSLLKAWFGDAATAENDYGFGACRRSPGNHSHFPTMLRALDGGLDGLFVMGQNPAVGSQHAGLQRRALSRLKWLVVRDLRGDRDRDVLARLARGRVRRAAHRGHRDRGLPHARRDAHREGGLLHQHPAAPAVARQGARPARRLPLGAVVHAPPVQARAGALRRPPTAERDWPIRNLTWDYSEHGPHAEPSADEVLREINGYDVDDRRAGARLRGAGQTTARPPAAAGSTPASTPTASTRRGGASPATSGRAGRLGVARSGAGRGRPTAGSLYNRASAPTPTAQPWSERKRYVWWDEAEEQWTGYDVPDFPVDKPPGLRAPDDAERHGRDRRRRPVHHAGRRPRLAVLALRPARRPAADALRAARVAGRQRALPGRSTRQPGGAALGPRRQPGRRPRRSALAVRRHHVPAHRAPHGRRHVAQAAVAGGAAAGDVRRDRPDARARARDRGRRLDDDLIAPRAEIEARAMVTDRIRPLRVERPHGPPGRAAVALGLRRPAPRATRRTTSTRSRATRTSRSRSRRRSSATCARAAPARGDVEARRRPRAAARRGARPRPSGRDPAAPSDRARHPPAGRRAHGLLHRHDDVHRLQGVRGRVQAVERPARRRRHVPAAAAPTTTPARSAPPPGGTCASSSWPTHGDVDLVAAAERLPAATQRLRRLGLHVRRLQALHERRLPGRVPDRRADPHRVRDGRAPARRLQRLRLLHPACPFGVVDRDPDDGRAAKCTLCYDRLEDGLEPACAKACPTDSIQFGPYDELREVAARRVASAARARGRTARTSTARTTRRRTSWPAGSGAFFLLTEPPERYGLPAQADSPIQENVIPATPTAVGAGLLAAAGVAASLPVGAAAMSV